MRRSLSKMLARSHYTDWTVEEIMRWPIADKIDTLKFAHERARHFSRSAHGLAKFQTLWCILIAERITATINVHSPHFGGRKPR